MEQPIPIADNKSPTHPAVGLARIRAWLGIRPIQMACLGAGVLLSLAAARIAEGSASGGNGPAIPALAWSFGIGLTLLGGLRRLPPKWNLRWQTCMWVAILVFFALILRGVDTTHIPVTLTGDESEVGLNAVAVLQGRIKNIFGTGWHEFPALFYFLQSLVISWLGQTIPALRLPSALAGALTIGAVYLTGRAMFGNRTGLAAALLLTTLHYHLHFSRIGLNNIWDGLGYTITLGALWCGWRSGRRVYFLLAGLGLGVSQYFYPTSRMLFPIILAWLLINGLLDRARLKRILPDLTWMVVVTGVVVLPLAWHYVNHGNEFLGPIRAQSIFGSWMEMEMRNTGLESWQIVLRQVRLGLEAYLSTPITFWYKPYTPILRPLSAILFGFGFLSLALRPRDGRFHLLGLWLLAIGLAGGLSESTPAAQRYVAAAPACSLVVGFGALQGAAFLARWRPNAFRLIWAGCILLLAGIGADELRFYFLEYTPNSHYRNKYDFEGYGAAVAMRLAGYLQGYSDQWQVQFYGAPRLGYGTIPSLAYLAPAIRGFDALQPWGSPANSQLTAANRIYVFLEGHEQDFAAARDSLPGGLWVQETDAQGDLLYNLYQHPAQDGQNAIPQRGSDYQAGLLPPVLIWSAGYLLIAALLLWSLVRIKSAWRLFADDGYIEEWKPVGLAGGGSSESPSIGKAVSHLPPDSALSSTNPAADGDRIVERPEELTTLPPPDSPADIQPTTSAPSEPPLTQSPSQIIRLQIIVEVPAGANVQVTINAPPGQPVQISQQIQNAVSVGQQAWPETEARFRWPLNVGQIKTAWFRRASALASRLPPLPMTLFILAALLYLATRLVGLEDFPIYFFTDEAVQTTLAEDFLRQNFRDRSGEIFPTYFENAGQYNLGVSVYTQAIPYLLFGKSVFVTRLTSVLFTLLGALAVGLLLREAFALPYWWSGVLFLSITPTWFLHSRTAFETVEATAFYACFLYAYLLYRLKAPRYLYPALAFGALTFYAYSPTQLVMVLTGFLLLISDWRYHWTNRKTALRGLGLLTLLALPYVRYLLVHPTEDAIHLKILHSYWLQSIPLSEKLQKYFSEYLYGLSPGYWFIPNGHDLARHLMKGSGHLLRATLPFAALGLGLALTNVFRQPRSSAYRAILVALLAAPSGSSLVGIGITRVLSFVVPAVILTAIGVSACLDWIEKRGAPRSALALGLFAVLSLYNIALTRDALVNGPTWFRDYTLGGLQYGARQVFATLQDYLQSSPETKIILSPNWTNGTDEVARFFLAEPGVIQLGSIEGHMLRHLPLDDSMLFIMMPNEFQKSVSSGKFRDIRVEDTLPYPDGQPGFYLVRLRYAENIDEILAAERAARRQLRQDQVILDGQSAPIQHSLLDMGEISAAFDGNLDTLIRSMEANPLVIELAFPVPRTLLGVSVRVGGTPTTLTVRATPTGETSPEIQVQQVDGSVEARDLSVAFSKPILTERLMIEVLNTFDGEPAHVHVWEITLR